MKKVECVYFDADPIPIACELGKIIGGIEKKFNIDRSVIIYMVTYAIKAH